MRIPTKLEQWTAFSASAFIPFDVELRAGNLGEKRTTPERWSYMIGMDRFNWLQLLKKLPNLTVLGALDRPSCI